MDTLESQVSEFSKLVPPSTKVVDLGCGLRPYEKYFHHAQYIGVDVEVSGRQAQDKRADIYYDGLTLPFEAQSLGGILCTQVLEHCADDTYLIQEMWRTLAPGGFLLVTVPFMWGEHEVPYDYRRFTSFGIQKKLIHQGFELVQYQKIDQGLEAIKKIIESEILHAQSNRSPLSILEKVKLKLMRVFYRFAFKLNQELFSFDRVFLDNAIVVKKPENI